jgi:hypothetical protein
VNGALKAVEHMGSPIDSNRKQLVVFISTSVALLHDGLLLPRQEYGPDDEIFSGMSLYLVAHPQQHTARFEEPCLSVVAIVGAVMELSSNNRFYGSANGMAHTSKTSQTGTTDFLSEIPVIMTPCHATPLFYFRRSLFGTS